jgi:AraC family transcriptional regulator
LVAAAVRTIELHYDQPLRVSDLAGAAYLSRYRFSELFTAVMGRSPRDYIRHVRIERAKHLLATTAMPISDIARATGFEYQTSFANAFGATTGLSPRRFRQKAQSP